MAARFLMAVAVLGAVSLSLAGSAAGQEWYPPQPRIPQESGWPGRSASLESRQTKDAWLSALHDYRLACEADRETLCADKASNSTVFRCLTYHRLKVISSCKEALKGLSAAAAGRPL